MTLPRLHKLYPTAFPLNIQPCPAILAIQGGLQLEYVLVFTKIAPPSTPWGGQSGGLLQNPGVCGRCGHTKAGYVAQGKFASHGKGLALRKQVWRNPLTVIGKGKLYPALQLPLFLVASYVSWPVSLEDQAASKYIKRKVCSAVASADDSRSYMNLMTFVFLWHFN